MAGTIVVDRIESDSSYTSTINVASKVNFTGGMQIGGQDSPMSGFKNKIQNGDFRIFQRGTSNTSITTNNAGIANTATYLGPDRFKTYNHNEKNQWVPGYTIQQTRDHPSFGTAGTCLEYLCTTAAAMPSYASGGLCMNTLLYHPEFQDIMEFISGDKKPFTISFWVKSNKIGTYSMHVRIPNTVGTNGNIIKAYTINQANTWEKKVIVFPSASAAGYTLNNPALYAMGVGIEWIMATNYTPAVDSGMNAINEQWGLYNSWGIGSTGQVNLHDTVGNYFRITDIQMEAGTTATEFERRPIQVELAMCKRYFETFRNTLGGTNTPLPTAHIYNNGDGTFALYFNQKLEVEKRIPSPSVTFSANGATLLTSYANNTSSGVFTSLYTGNPTPQTDVGTTQISWYHNLTNGSAGNAGMAALCFLKTNQWINISADI